MMGGQDQLDSNLRRSSLEKGIVMTWRRDVEEKNLDLIFFLFIFSVINRRNNKFFFLIIEENGESVTLPLICFFDS